HGIGGLNDSRLSIQQQACQLEDDKREDAEDHSVALLWWFGKTRAAAGGFCYARQSAGRKVGKISSLQ
ncbi:MAG: hypothetical protein KDC44_00465, partial [Phaeodactylibacter sp.]|nr:hypothetical protein [Phaeodactylibacter sp.]